AGSRTEDRADGDLFARDTRHRRHLERRVDVDVLGREVLRRLVGEEQRHFLDELPEVDGRRVLVPQVRELVLDERVADFDHGHGVCECSGRMRTIGVLGGMTWHSTADYYRFMNTRVREELGGSHSARVLVSSVDQAEIEPLMEAGRWDEAGVRLAEDAVALERAGADVFILACNSLHTSWEAIVAPLTIPAIHIGDATAAAIPDSVERVALLGTRY